MTATDRLPLIALLNDLYAKQAALRPDDRYLADHRRPAVVDKQVRTFAWYRPFLPESGTLLDWGCNHAPDSCLLRAAFGDRYELLSCDFGPPGQFAAFAEFARTKHVELTDPVRLPYADHSIDAVIASGVLEHAAMDYESLKELYRILKPDGLLVISHLPYWLSTEEWRNRRRKTGYHMRLYGRGELSQLLKRSGFYPREISSHTFARDKLLERLGLPLPGLKALIPVHPFPSTLKAIARKVTSM